MALEDERRAALDMIAQLERRIDGSDRDLHALETVPAMLAEINRKIDKIDRRLDDGDRRMAEFEKGLAANTAITTSVRDAQIAGRVITGAIKWLAAMVVAMGVIWAAASHVIHPQNLPPGAGK